MRLESGAGVSSAMALLLRFHYALVLLVALAGVLVWVPAPALAATVARPGIVVTAVYVWQIAGIQLYHQATLADNSGWQPGLLAFLLLPLGMAALALLLAPLAGAMLLLGALVLLYQPERAPSLSQQWPAAWRKSRYQQTQLLAVALASMAVYLWYGD